MMSNSSSPSSPSFSSPSSSGNKNNLLSDIKKREIRLREHELELLQLESNIQNSLFQISKWYDQCNKILQDSNIKDINLPDLPLQINQSSNQSSNSSDLIKNILKDFDTNIDDKIFPVIDNKNSNNNTKQIEKKSGGLIEQLTKPPNESELIQNAKLVNNNLDKRLFIKKKNNKKKNEEKYINKQKDNEENIKNDDNNNQINNDNDNTKEEMRDYLHSSLGISNGSLFDDTDIESGMDILNKIIQQKSIKQTSLQNKEKIASVGSVVKDKESLSELPRTRSTIELPRHIKSKETRKFTNGSITNDHFPADIINVSRKIQGLNELLQPYRILKFKFAATVELPKTQQVQQTRLNPFRLSKRLRSSSSSVLELQNVKCLIIIFDDIVCVCSEKKLEIRLNICETWMKTDLLNSSENIYPFTFNTPERTIKCFLDQETKIKALKKIWKATVHARLDQQDNYIDNSSRILTYEFKSGDIYEGEWKNTLFHGKGILRYNNGDYFEGYFINGKKNGFGTFIYSNKQRYDGYWKNDYKSGKGTLYYTTSDSNRIKFVGNWEDNEQHGPGELFLKDGSILTSNWKFGNPIHPSILYLDDRSARYIGDISESFKREGFGVLILSNGDRYYGQWNNGDRHGKGFYITSKQTEYNGIWLNNQMEGQGTLCFGNDESIISGKFSGDISSSIVKVDGEFKLNKYDSQTQRLSTLQGYKWHCLFTMRLTNIDIISEIQILNDNLINSIQSNNIDDIKDNLKIIFSSNLHPLGKLISEYINIFKLMYNKPHQYFMQLSNAVDDIKAFLNLLSDSFLCQFLKCNISQDITSNTLQEILFPEIYDILIIMYDISYEELNKKSSKTINSILELSFKQQMAVCGIPKKYWNLVEEFVSADIRLKALDLNPSEDKAPYQNALKAIRSMKGKYTVNEKLECVKLAASRVELLLKKLVNQFGADEFLPMFSLILLQAEIQNLQSECNFMEDFMNDTLRFNVYGYVLAQMQISVGFFVSCNITERLAASKIENLEK